MKNISKPWIFKIYILWGKGKNSVTSEEEKAFLTLAQIKLNNMGYVVYLENQEFVYNNSNMRVQPNELIIAIKEKAKVINYGFLMRKIKILPIPNSTFFKSSGFILIGIGAFSYG